MQKNEDGFTLVELIISMAIFSIVAIVIMMFLQTGANSYQRARNELDLQMESQMLINQIRDMAYSANYAEYNDAGTTRTLTLYHITQDYTPASTVGPSAAPGVTAAPASVSKRITTCQIIVWDSSKQKLYYDKAETTSPTGSVSEPTPNLSDNGWCNEHLFCNYMKNFKVATDGTGKIPNNTINLTLDMQARSRKYSITEDITVRNGWVEYP